MLRNSSRWIASPKRPAAASRSASSSRARAAAGSGRQSAGAAAAGLRLRLISQISRATNQRIRAAPSASPPQNTNLKIGAISPSARSKGSIQVGGGGGGGAALKSSCRPRVCNSA